MPSTIVPMQTLRPGELVYAMLRTYRGTLYRTGGTLEVYDHDDRSSFAVDAVEDGDTGCYLLTLPEDLPAEEYFVDAFVKEGTAGPADSDELLWQRSEYPLRFDGADVEPTEVPGSDPPYVTGRYLCLDAEGVPEADVEVKCAALAGGGVGLAFSGGTRTSTSGLDGYAYFTNMVLGAKYQVKRDSGDWQVLAIPRDAEDTVDLDDLVGAADA